MPDPVNQFLQAEERATATLMGFYADARDELERFIRGGDLTTSEQAFYRQLLSETNRVAAAVQGKAEGWADTVIRGAHSAGWRTNSTNVVPTGALEALSRSTLSLITQTTDGIRQTIRNAIAGGILKGSSSADVRAAILSSGLTNIPHWPTVEYRAGVIARTETMRAYNAGAIAGLIDNGARFVRWITSPDEAVCPICLPRDEVVFRIGSPDSFPGDPYPRAQALPHIPAHPRCRCTIVAEYRDPDGKVIRQGVPEIDPKLPADAMGGDMPGTVPATIGDAEAAMRRDWDQAQLDAERISNRMLGFVDGRTTPFSVAKEFGGHAPPGGDLAGFENRLKTWDSTLKKLRIRFDLDSTGTATEIASQIRDLVRYTMRFEPGDFTTSVLSTKRRLLAEGYKLVKFEPIWRSSYKGVNTNWISPDGRLFELQFHTPTSFASKEATHPFLDLQKGLEVGSPEWQTLENEMNLISSRVAQPAGWDRLLTRAQAAEQARLAEAAKFALVDLERRLAEASSSAGT